MSTAPGHLTVIGDRTGAFVIEKELPDGRLVIRPEEAAAPQTRPGRPMTEDEFASFLAEHGSRMLAADDEG